MKEIKLEELEITDDNIDDVIGLIKVCSKKNKIIRKQMYEKAAKLRDEERKLIEKFINKHNIVLKDYSKADYKKYIRELKLKKLFNESQR